MRQYHSHSVEQEVELLYSFDVHANAFFCSFLLTHVLQVSLIYVAPKILEVDDTFASSVLFIIYDSCFQFCDI